MYWLQRERGTLTRVSRRLQKTHAPRHAAHSRRERGMPENTGQEETGYTSLKAAFFCFDSIDAWAAAKRATGIRYGEQDT